MLHRSHSVTWAWLPFVLQSFPAQKSANVIIALTLVREIQQGTWWGSGGPGLAQGIHLPQAWHRGNAGQTPALFLPPFLPNPMDPPLSSPWHQWVAVSRIYSCLPPATKHTLDSLYPCPSDSKVVQRSGGVLNTKDHGIQGPSQGRVSPSSVHERVRGR